MSESTNGNVLKTNGLPAQEMQKDLKAYFNERGGWTLPSSIS